jgi:hypothetical protein
MTPTSTISPDAVNLRILPKPMCMNPPVENNEGLKNRL